MAILTAASGEQGKGSGGLKRVSQAMEILKIAVDRGWEAGRLVPQFWMFF
jgi:hypothetical protein